MSSIVRGGLIQDKAKKAKEEAKVAQIDQRISFDNRTQDPAEQAKLQKLFLKYGGSEVIGAPKAKAAEVEMEMTPSKP